MIRYHYETTFRLKGAKDYNRWLENVVHSEGSYLGDIDFIFTSDTTLLEMNQQYLKHDYYTDIITFDYSVDKRISGDVFISIDRVSENAAHFKVGLMEEVRRVMVHGVLHLMGYSDDTEKNKEEMRVMEDKKIKLFHVEQ